MLLAFVNLDKWNALPKSYQAILEHAGHYANNWMMAKYDQVNPPALRKLLANGAKLHAFSQPIMEACFKAANDIYADKSTTNPAFKKIYDSMKAFRGEEYLWFQVTEGTYDNFMMAQQRAGTL